MQPMTIPTQTKRGMKTFIQCKKPKKMVVLEGDNNCCKHLVAMLKSEKGAQIQLNKL